MMYEYDVSSYAKNAHGPCYIDTTHRGYYNES
jgi:hypothetical protein